MTKLNSVRRMVALSLAMLVAVITLACSCQLGNLTKLATEIAPTKAVVVQTAILKPTRAPAPTQTPTPVPTSVPVTGKMTLHTNEEAGLHIQYPADWFVESEAEGSYFAKAESGLDTMDPTDGPVFGVFVGPLADIETGVGTIESVEQLMDALLSEEGFIPEGGEIGEYETLRPDVLVVPAHWVDKDTEQLWHVLLGVTISGKRAAVMAGVTAAEEWESYLDVFRTMAGSVELFEPTATPQVVPTKEVMKFTAREVPGTATDLNGALEFNSYRGWMDEEGDFQIAAEVTNVSDRTYNTYIDVYWRLLDANGDVLLEDNSFLDLSLIHI